tara:strand:+ start:2661 stop:2945 length:285 start_codon:yes stop_codon:yes gene_type:complete
MKKKTKKTKWIIKENKKMLNNNNRPRFNVGDFVYERPHHLDSGIVTHLDSGIVTSYIFSNGVHRYIVNFFGTEIEYREEELEYKNKVQQELGYK